MTKKYFLIIAAVMLLSMHVYALPTLQLDIEGGYYDTVTETIIASDPEFDLYALLNGDSLLGKVFYLSAAVVPALGESVPSPDKGFFTFNNNVINVVGDMEYGIPPLALEDSVKWSLPGHDVYETYYTEFAFSINPDSTLDAYNSQPGSSDQPSTGDLLFYNKFRINTSGLSYPYVIHFDLYTDVAGKKVFAPFSHDAQSSATPIPEPATMMLLGSVILGFLAFRRKKKALS